MFPYFKASSKFEDTLAYLTTTSFEKFAIVLSDVCTTLKDVAYLTIRLRTPIEIKTILEDTSPCSGNKIVYIVKAAAGNSSMYQWQWKDLTTNTILSKTDSLGLITKQTFKIELTVDDGCVNLGDAQQFTVFFNPPSEASILTDNGQFNDTSLCFKALNFFYQVKAELERGIISIGI